MSVKTVPKAVYRRQLFLTATIVAALDLLTKAWAVAVLENQSDIKVLGEFLKFSFVRNPGAAFSFGTGITWVFTVISTAVTIAVLLISRTVTNRPWAIALGGLLGGAVGNLIDRIFRSPEVLQGHVVDFISLPNYPMFNVSDSAVVLSAISMVILSLRGVEYQTPNALPTHTDVEQS